MRPLLLDIGLLILRVSAGGLMAIHGFQKLNNWTMMLTMMGDPIGLGVRFTLILAIFAELVCALLVVIGLCTRWATLPIIATMLTAFLIVHANDAFQVKELALAYLCSFIAIAFTGPGALSVDAMIRMRRSSRP